MWTQFRRHFEDNAARALPDLTGAHGVPADAQQDVADSLARFQLGESGEGRIAKDIDRYQDGVVDDDYRAALKLFVKEEGRHAVILGHLVRSLGGQLLRKTWTERLFVFGRRMMGIRLKLVVLLAAEVVGIGFYRAIAQALGEGTVKRALLQICADEEHHLAFHRAFFLRSTPTLLTRAVFVCTWAIVGTAACAVVLADHRRTLRTLRLSEVDVARTLFALIVDAASAPSAAPSTRAGRPAPPAEVRS